MTGRSAAQVGVAGLVACAMVIGGAEPAAAGVLSPVADHVIADQKAPETELTNLAKRWHLVASGEYYVKQKALREGPNLMHLVHVSLTTPRYIIFVRASNYGTPQSEARYWLSDDNGTMLNTFILKGEQEAELPPAELRSGFEAEKEFWLKRYASR